MLARTTCRSWGFWNSESRYAIVQGEVDITENLTAYAQAGIGTSNTRYLYSDIRVDSLNGNFNGTPRRNNQKHERTAAQAACARMSIPGRSTTPSIST
jgi:iron complex outermembrane receptor protein